MVVFLGSCFLTRLLVFYYTSKLLKKLQSEDIKLELFVEFPLIKAFRAVFVPFYNSLKHLKNKKFNVKLTGVPAPLKITMKELAVSCIPREAILFNFSL